MDRRKKERWTERLYSRGRSSQRENSLGTGRSELIHRKVLPEKGDTRGDTRPEQRSLRKLGKEDIHRQYSEYE